MVVMAENVNPGELLATSQRSEKKGNSIHLRRRPSLLG
ncbi:MAG: hypothetical protein Ct9H90mP14_3410 [Methanobacteriota archaeon]|nr:MAG: hypothetical protein Ct9H90mP14_3410 [Euryarchaeota archaeon]